MCRPQSGRMLIVGRSYEIASSIAAACTRAGPLCNIQCCILCTNASPARYTAEHYPRLHHPLLHYGLGLASHTGSPFHTHCLHLCLMVHSWYMQGLGLLSLDRPSLAAKNETR